ncbi:MAG: DUF362 domain-containing protein [Actinomycetota bacterium]|nr:DUF362 domain-containing protein [Actinomycetota bacterium]
MPEAVYIRKASYDYDRLEPVVFELLEGTLAGRITPGMNVILKPNLLAPAAPQTAIATHPLIVRAAAGYVLSKGGRVTISDSPAIGSFERVISTTGLKEALSGLDVDFRQFKTSAEVVSDGPFKKLELAREALEAGLVINLPKLKTHAQMTLTAGVKNLFGCVVGMKKPQWHFRTGVDRQMFAMLLLEIYKAISPAATLVDGIMAMEGHGPGRSGTPRQLGVLLASRDAVRLDWAISTMLGLDPEIVPTCKAAKEAGLAPENFIVTGDVTADTLLAADFKFPDPEGLVFGPGPMKGFLRKHLVKQPVEDPGLCKLCGECWKYCPAHALEKKGRRLSFDYEKCIRCYCCLEVCPQGAISARHTLLGLLIGKLFGK